MNSINYIWKSNVQEKLLGAFLTLFLLLILLSNSNRTLAQENTDNLAHYGIRGMVACITYTDSVAQNVFNFVSCGIGPQPDSGYTIHQLDDRGNQLSCKFYSRDSFLLKQIDCQYDDAGNRIEMAFWGLQKAYLGTIVYKYDTTGYPIEKITYNKSDSILNIEDLGMNYQESDYLECYDKKGRRIKMINYMHGCATMETSSEEYDRLEKLQRESDGIADTTVTYDSLSTKLITITSSRTGASKRIKYMYNAEGKEVAVEEYGMDGKRQYILQKEYDERGNVIVALVKWENGFSASGYKVTTSYDLKGNREACQSFELKREYSIDTNNTKAWTDYYIPSWDTLYDAKGRVKECTQYVGGIVYTRTVYEYDANNNAVHTLTYNKCNSLIGEGFARYEDIDEYGNWRKVTHWFWNDDNYGYQDYIPSVSYRRIKYYE